MYHFVLGIMAWCLCPTAFFLWANHRWGCHFGFKLHRKKRQWGLPFVFFLSLQILIGYFFQTNSHVVVAPDSIWNRGGLNNISPAWWSGGPHLSLWCQSPITFECDGKNQTVGVHLQTLWNVGAHREFPPWMAGLGWMGSKGLLTVLHPFPQIYKNFWVAAGLWTQLWVQLPHRQEDLPSHRRSNWLQSSLGWGLRCPSLTPSCLVSCHL